jgi:hypothetical protein
VIEGYEERLAKNQILFRVLNENIANIAATLSGDEPFEFICECATSGCFERLSLSLPDYQHVRENGSHFLLAGGHEDLSVEMVTEKYPGYVVVEKDGVAGLMAHDENPRA